VILLFTTRKAAYYSCNENRASR